MDGTVIHQPDDRFLKIQRGRGTNQDVLVEATFYNPYATAGQYWEHGFLLKDGSSNSQYWVSIDSNGEWLYFHRLGKNEAIDRMSQHSSHINWEPGGKNELQVAMLGETGYVYINGAYEGSLAMNADTGGNGITLFVDDEHAGETRFEDFTVWKWDQSLASLFPDTDPGFMPTPAPVTGTTYDPEVSFSDLRGSHELRRTMPDRWQLIRELPWVADGLVFSEKEGVQGLVRLALHGDDFFSVLLRQPWVAEGKNLPTLDALGRLARWNPEQFELVVKHENVRDGISDGEAKIFSTLNGVAESNPDLIETLLNGSKVSIEESVIEMPSAGQLLLTIIRTRPGSASTMGLLETAVHTTGEFMGIQFPVRQLNYLFGDAVNPGSDGTNYGTHASTLPFFDSEDTVEKNALLLLAHEVAHFYWREGEGWIDEGGANFIEAVQSNAYTGWPLHPRSGLCPYAQSISELEALNAKVGTPEYSCNYGLGERLFHGLYRVLGEETFRAGFTALYLLRLKDVTNDNCQGTHLGICHVEAAFKAQASPVAAADIDQVIACWYEGDTEACPDTGPPDPRTPLLGPLSGSIPHQPEDGYLELSEGFDLSGDVMIETTFENAYPREIRIGTTVFSFAPMAGLTEFFFPAGKSGITSIIRKQGMISGEEALKMPRGPMYRKVEKTTSD